MWISTHCTSHLSREVLPPRRVKPFGTDRSCFARICNIASSSLYITYHQPLWNGWLLWTGINIAQAQVIFQTGRASRESRSLPPSNYNLRFRYTCEGVKRNENKIIYSSGRRGSYSGLQTRLAGWLESESLDQEHGFSPTNSWVHCHNRHESERTSCAQKHFIEHLLFLMLFTVGCLVFRCEPCMWLG